MWRIAIGLSLSLPLLAQVDFATTIHPILVTRCAPCHSGPQAPAGFSVESRPAILSAIKPRSPGESLLLKRVKAGEMPPSGGKLSDAQIASA
jgi:mono/diheme cytochrome c family protein